MAARASLLGIRRYVQRRTTDPQAYGQLAASRNAPHEFDGIAELWVERTALTQPLPPSGRQAARELLEDEGRFIDLPASPIFVVRDHEIRLPMNATAEGRG